MPYEQSIDSEYLRCLDSETTSAKLSLTQFVDPLLIPKAGSYIEVFTGTVFHQLRPRLIPCLLTAKRKASDNILMNLVNAHYENSYLVISMDKTHYSNSRAELGMKHYSYAVYKDVVRALISANFAYRKRGYYKRNSGHGEATKLWLSSKAIELLTITTINATGNDGSEYVIQSVNQNFYLVTGLHLNNVDRADRDNLVITKKQSGNLSPPEQIHCASLSAKLRKYNELIAKHTVLLPIAEHRLDATEAYSAGDIIQRLDLHWEPVTIADTQTEILKSLPVATSGFSKSTIATLLSSLSSPLSHDTAPPLISNTQSFSRRVLKCRPIRTSIHRVYSREYDRLGGRFYGAEYQQLSSKERLSLFIDGESVVEIDFSAFHTNMLYHMSGIDPIRDPYDLYEGNEIMRSAVKLMMNIMLNSHNRVNAMKAFDDEMSKDFIPLRARNKAKYQKKLDDNKRLRFEMRRLRISTYGLIDLIYTSHPQLQGYFFKPTGLRLQKHDSDLALDIIMQFTERRIPILCIHDSFIVTRRYAEELELVMRQQYYKHFGYNCILKREVNSTGSNELIPLTKFQNPVQHESNYQFN